MSQFKSPFPQPPDGQGFQHSQWQPPVFPPSVPQYSQSQSVQPSSPSTPTFSQQPLQKSPGPRRRWKQLATLGGVIVVALVIIFSMIGYGAASHTGNAPPKGRTTPPTQHPAQVAVQNTVTPTATPFVLPTATPTPVPTPKPTATPTPTPTPVVMVPTPTPKPMPPPPTPTPCPGVNCNPWGYNFTPGNLISYPPNNFCDYFNCIASFWGSDDPGDGYVVECQDSTYSQSGGESGACSSHGGVWRPLYSH